VTLPGQRTAALHTLTSDCSTILRFVTRLQGEVGPVRCCYEAGPCGFELQRALVATGSACDVIAPALIPRRAGDRVNGSP
jgi:transposase